MTLLGKLVEFRDRLTRFGFNSIKILLEKTGKRIVVVKEALNGKEELFQDWVGVRTRSVARNYGQRRSRRKTQKLIAELKKNGVMKSHEVS